jgi:hypothetical protein
MVAIWRAFPALRSLGERPNGAHGKVVAPLRCLEKQASLLTLARFQTNSEGARKQGLLFLKNKKQKHFRS